ncbi:MAG: hypothetical protein OXI43_22255, partial [Candidatus Poribacteria bacterium]|nr:hypothetical protein [Candidatus Poribacteria bacterium]
NARMAFAMIHTVDLVPSARACCLNRRERGRGVGAALTPMQSVMFKCGEVRKPRSITDADNKDRKNIPISVNCKLFEI